jgi:hypothetical protein
MILSRLSDTFHRYKPGPQSTGILFLLDRTH